MPSLEKHISIVCCILVIGCDNLLQNYSEDVDTTTLDVYMELELDSNGYYDI